MEKLDKTRYGADKMQLYYAVQLLIRNQNEIIERLERMERESVPSAPPSFSIDDLPYSKELKKNGFGTIGDVYTALENGLKPMPGIGEARLKQIQTKVLEIDKTLKSCYN